MSLLSATVLRVRPAGVTGDFCPICRRERRFRLGVAERRRVILLMDRGRVGHEHHELTCQTCRCKMERSVSERPLPPEPRRPTGAALVSFEPECLPIVRHRIESCTRMEQARRDGRLKPEARQEMIRQAVHCFARAYDEEPTERVTPLASGLLLLATVVLGGGAAVALLRLDSPVLAVVCAAGVVLLWAGLWYWIVAHSPRKQVRTWLAMALAPLDPSREEIASARRELQAVRMGAGFKIRTDKVRAKIEKIRRSGMVPG